MKKVVIYHPQALLSVCLRDVVDRAGVYVVLDAVSCVEDLYDAVRRGGVDIILMSGTCGNVSMIEVIKNIRRFSPHVKMVVYAQGEVSSLFSYMAIREGVTAIMPSHIDGTSLILELGRVSSDTYDTPIPMIEGRAKRLSRREIEVLNLLTEGYSLIDIAGVLGLSEKTISTYKTRLYHKLNVSSIVELLAQYNSLVKK